MSRHRAVRNLDLDDYLDDAVDDDLYDHEVQEELSADDKVTMAAKLKEVRQILGDTPGIKDSEIKETLWYYYFDVEQTISWLLNKHAGVPASTNATPTKAKAKNGSTLSYSGYLVVAPFARVMEYDLTVAVSRAGQRVVESLFEDLKPVVTSSVMRAHGQWGLLGGSSNQDKSNAKPKSSKLAKLAQSNRGAFERKGIQRQKQDLESVSRLASLTSSTRPQSQISALPSTEILSVPEPTAQPGITDATTSLIESDDVKASTDLRADHLLAEPSTLANSLFHLWVAPNIAADSLLRTYADPYLLTVSDRSQLQKAFSTASPDDVVRNAQNKDLRTATAAQTKQPDVAELASQIQSAEISDDDDSTDSQPKSSKPLPTKKKKTLDEIKEQIRLQEGSSVSFVIIGHVDAGKSTLMGRLLYELKAVDERTVQKYRQESQKAGKGSFALAWIMDQSEEERKRGVTIDVASQSFSTPKRSFHVLDAPGHRDFIPNMIAGATQADFALLVLDASHGGFESGFAPLGQTREHALLVRSLGVQKLVVAINKLDAVEWSETRYDEIVTQMRQFLSQVGYSIVNVAFIPCSGLDGVNLVLRSNLELLSWYSGPTLLECIESIDIPPRSLDLPLRMSITDISKGLRTNVVNVTGRLESGILQVGDTVISEPGGLRGTVRSLSTETDFGFCIAGDVAIAAIHGIDQTALRAGDVVCHVDSPIPVCSEFTARVITFEVARPVIQGSPIVIHRGRIDEPGTVKQIIALIDKSDGHVLKKKPRHIPVGGAAMVRIQLTNKRGIPVEPFQVNRGTGRIVLRNEGVTVGAGVVTSLE